MLERFNLSHASLRLLKFSNTALYRVDTPQGRFVLRLHPPKRMPEAVLRSELDWLRILCQQTSLWTPEPVAAPDNQLLVMCHLPDQSDYRYGALFRWMGGQHKLRCLTAIDAYRMGQCLGELHAFAANYTPPPTFTRWKLDWGAFADEIAHRPSWLALAPEDTRLLAHAITRIRLILEQLERSPDAIGLIHGDTNLSNFRFDGSRVGLLDFEVCCFGYYLFDVTRTLLDFAQLGDRAPQLEVAFYRGYTSFRPLPALDDQAMVAFRMMNIVDLIVWILRWDERMPRDTGPERVRQALRQLRQLVPLRA